MHPNLQRYLRFSTRCAVAVACAGVAWCVWALADWLRDAYDAQEWLQEQHLGLVVLAAEIIAGVGRVAVASLGLVVGVVAALLLPLPNQPLQATAAPPRS